MEVRNQRQSGDSSEEFCCAVKQRDGAAAGRVCGIRRGAGLFLKEEK